MRHAKRDEHQAVLVATGCDAPALDDQAAALTVIAGHDAQQGADVDVATIPVAGTGKSIMMHTNTVMHARFVA